MSFPGIPTTRLPIFLTQLPRPRASEDPRKPRTDLSRPLALIFAAYSRDPSLVRLIEKEKNDADGLYEDEEETLSLSVEVPATGEEEARWEERRRSVARLMSIVRAFIVLSPLYPLIDITQLPSSSASQLPKNPLSSFHSTPRPSGAEVTLPLWLSSHLSSPKLTRTCKTSRPPPSSRSSPLCPRAPPRDHSTLFSSQPSRVSRRSSIRRFRRSRRTSLPLHHHAHRRLLRNSSPLRSGAPSSLSSSLEGSVSASTTGRGRVPPRRKAAQVCSSADGSVGSEMGGRGLDGRHWRPR